MFWHHINSSFDISTTHEMNNNSIHRLQKFWIQIQAQHRVQMNVVIQIKHNDTWMNHWLWSCHMCSTSSSWRCSCTCRSSILQYSTKYVNLVFVLPNHHMPSHKFVLKFSSYPLSFSIVMLCRIKHVFMIIHNVCWLKNVACPWTFANWACNNPKALLTYFPTTSWD